MFWVDGKRKEFLSFDRKVCLGLFYLASSGLVETDEDLLLLLFPFFFPFYTDLANKLFGVEWKGFWLRGSRVGIYRIWYAFRPLFWWNIQPHSSWNIGGKGLFMKGLLAWKEREFGGGAWRECHKIKVTSGKQ